MNALSVIESLQRSLRSFSGTEHRFRDKGEFFSGFRRWLTLWLIMSGMLIGMVTVAHADVLTEVFKRVHPSVVVVQTEHHAPTGDQSGLPAAMAGVGSGVLISKEGKVLTASHVVHSADRIVVKFKSGEEIPARVVSSERFADVALLQLERLPGSGAV